MKKRWIYLPPGSTIDVSNPDAWVFPKGTILWMEFSEGERVETRMLEKVVSGPGIGAWRASNYLWLADQSDARRSIDGLPPSGGEFAIEAMPEYRAATEESCMGCHQGSADVALGFSALQLSDSSLKGNIENWASYLSAPQAPAKMVGSELDQEVLGTLHSNCGTCHSAAGTQAELGMDLSYSIATATDVTTTNAVLTAAYEGLRMTPGRANESEIYQRLWDGETGIYPVAPEFRVRLAEWIEGLQSQTAVVVEDPIVDAGSPESAKLLGYGITTQDPDDPDRTAFVMEDEIFFSSRAQIAVDTTKTYCISGEFKSVGDARSELLFGVAPHDANGNFIPDEIANRTGNAVAIDLAATTSTEVKTTTNINSAWSRSNTAKYRGVGFYFDGDTTHLPDYVLFDKDIGAYDQSKTSGKTIALNMSIPPEVMSQLTPDTKVMNHLQNTTYRYAAGSTVNTVPRSWTRYRGEISGEDFGYDRREFRPGTKYAKIAFIANWRTDAATSLLFDSLALTEGKCP